MRCHRRVVGGDPEFDVHTTTPDVLRGRITALHTLATQSGPRIGDIRASLTAEAVGVAPALAIGGAVAVAGVVAIARVFPELLAYPAETISNPGHIDSG